MAEEVVDKWLVIQAEDQDQYGGIWMAVAEFCTLDDAKKFVENVIRNEWYPMTDITTPDGVRNLADMPGYVYPQESIKWSRMYYSDDGMEAWCSDPPEGIYRKISICKKGNEGERVS